MMEPEGFPAEPVQEPEGDDLTGLPAIAQCARRGRPFQRVAYIRGMAAAAQQAPFSESVMVLAPLLHELAGDPSDEIRAETALQLAPIGQAWRQSAGPEQAEELQEDLAQLLRLGADLLQEGEVVGEHGEHALVELGRLLDNKMVRARLLPLLDGIEEDEVRSDDETHAAVTRVLAQLADGCSAETCEAELLPRILRRAEDSAFQVRQEAAVGMACLSPRLSSAPAHISVLATYLRLAGDRVWSVRQACAQVLPDISRVADPSMRSMQLLPLCERFAGDVSRWVQLAALQTLGPFIATLDADEVPHSLLHSFAGMPSSAAGAEGLDLQFACAFNLPAVLHTLGPPAWPVLHPAFDWLTGSGEARNRCTLACSLHEVARMVGPQTAQRDLMRAARVLSGDRHPAVHEGVLQHAADLLAAMPPECRQQLYGMLLSATRTQAAGSWRGRLCLAQQLRACSALEPLSRMAFEAAVRMCQDSVAAVRAAAAEELAGIAAGVLSHSGASSELDVAPRSPEEAEERGPQKLEGPGSPPQTDTGQQQPAEQSAGREVSISGPPLLEGTGEQQPDDLGEGTQVNMASRPPPKMGASRQQLPEHAVSSEVDMNVSSLEAGSQQRAEQGEGLLARQLHQTLVPSGVPQLPFGEAGHHQEQGTLSEVDARQDLPAEQQAQPVAAPETAGDLAAPANLAAGRDVSDGSQPMEPQVCQAAPQAGQGDAQWVTGQHNGGGADPRADPDRSRGDCPRAARVDGHVPASGRNPVLSPASSTSQTQSSNISDTSAFPPFEEAVPTELTTSEVVDSIEQLSHATFQQRQTFVAVIRHLFQTAPLLGPTFLLSLLPLAHDEVPNVRLAFARLLADSAAFRQIPEAQKAFQLLKIDSDPDVRQVTLSAQACL